MNDFIEIPFGAEDSELKGWEYTIPEDMEAVIKDGKIIVRQKTSKDERIRKELIEALRQLDREKSPVDTYQYQEWIAWLEKQKEQEPKMTPKWLYRLEFKDSSCGLWYDGSGKWCFESGIGSIGGCKTKTLPMDYDARYKQDGRDWFSSCSRKEDLMHWYSLEDAKELISKGFVFTRYLATEYHEYDQQTVFIKETALCREQIDIFELFGQKSAEWREEDEVYLQDALWCVKQATKVAKSENDMGACWSAERWLKSLHPQPHWKPSEEQMGVELEKLGEIARHLIAVKDHEEDMRLDEGEWLLLERIGYPERFNARKEE